MANTVNVTTANTFEQWRVKTNELGTKIGDLDEVTNSDIGATTIVAAVKAHQSIVAGSITLSGGVEMTGDLDWADNAKIKMGTTNDLEIYHDGNNSYISDVGTGNLLIKGTNLSLRSASNEDFLVCTTDGSVAVKHNNSTKIATTATGVDVTGVITADGLDIDDDHIIKIGTGDDLQIYHNGTHSYIADSGTGQLKVITNGTGIDIQKDETETMAKFIVDGAVKLYHNNVKKFETTAAGGTLTGALTVGAITASGAISPASDSAIDLGTTGVRFKDAFVDTITVTGEVDAASLDISGNADIDGTLEADAITVGGITLATTIATTVGAMIGGNTESGINVTYEASDNTIDFDVNDPTITLTGAVTGTGTITNLGSVTIATTSGAGNIVTDDIADNAVTQAKMADDSVGSSEMKSLSTLLIINSAGTTVKTLHGAGA
jgi:hypothetical protein